MNDFMYCKLEIFIPESHFNLLAVTLQQMDAGHIGQYDSCLSFSKVVGRWRPMQDANPYIGQINEVSTEEEIKVEVVCLTESVEKTLDAIIKIHPYEMPLINVIPLYSTSLMYRHIG